MGGGSAGSGWDGMRRAGRRWEGGGQAVGREEAKAPYRHFGLAVATWCSYKAPTMLRRHS